MKYGKSNTPLGKRILRSPFVLAAALILFAVLIRATWNIHQKSAASLARLGEAQIELNKIKDRQTDLSNKVAELSSDGGIEAQIRTQFRAVKEGEQVAVLVDPGNPAAVADATSTARILNGWQKFWHLFGFYR